MPRETVKAIVLRPIGLNWEENSSQPDLDALALRSHLETSLYLLPRQILRFNQRTFLERRPCEGRAQFV